jgi:hypothetical protein
MNSLETYPKERTEIRASGAAVKEVSYYGPLASPEGTGDPEGQGAALAPWLAIFSGQLACRRIVIRRTRSSTSLPSMPRFPLLYLGFPCTDLFTKIFDLQPKRAIYGEKQIGF